MCKYNNTSLQFTGNQPTPEEKKSDGSGNHWALSWKQKLFINTEFKKIIPVFKHYIEPLPPEMIVDTRTLKRIQYFAPPIFRVICRPLIPVATGPRKK